MTVQRFSTGNIANHNKLTHKLQTRPVCRAFTNVELKCLNFRLGNLSRILLWIVVFLGTAIDVAIQNKCQTFLPCNQINRSV